MVTVPTPTTADTRTPAMMAGRASGNSTCVSRCRDVIPMASAASRMAESIERMPAAVVRITGSSAYKISATRAVRAPTPPTSGNGSRKPKSARLGTVWMMLAAAAIGAPTRGRRAATMPTGTPTATAAAVEITTSAMCCPKSVQSSDAWSDQKWNSDATAQLKADSTSVLTVGCVDASSVDLGPHSTSTPASSTPMRSASVKASRMSWVTRTMVLRT
jgi:hypothetical protein